MSIVVLFIDLLYTLEGWLFIVKMFFIVMLFYKRLIV